DPVEQLRILAARRRHGAGEHRGAVRGLRPVRRRPQLVSRPDGRRNLGRRTLRRVAPWPRRVGHHAGRAVDVVAGDGAGIGRDLAGFRKPAPSVCAHGRCPMNRIATIAVSVLALALAACSNEAPQLDQYGANPEIPEPNRTLMPDMIIAKPAAWGDKTPTVP